MASSELINVAVSSAISNNDAIAKLYLKLRQDSLEVYSVIQKELADNGKVSNDSRITLEKLRFEKDRLAVEYPAHIDRLIAQITFVNKKPDNATEKIEKEYVDLAKQKEEVEAEIQRLQHTQGPVVEKMHVLVRNYNKILEGKKLSERENTGQDDTIIDPASYSFSQDELKAAFADLNEKFNTYLSKCGLSVREMLDIDTNHQIEKLVRESKAFHKGDDSVYIYNKAVGLSPSIGDATVSIREMELTIEGLTKEIFGILEETQEAKRNWTKNARILEQVKFDDDDKMDIDAANL